tara:strand:- start:2925 stop:3053 length:129 start_codon:yes stop_codon:yes gene_type:complete
MGKIVAAQDYDLIFGFLDSTIDSKSRNKIIKEAEKYRSRQPR